MGTTIGASDGAADDGDLPSLTCTAADGGGGCNTLGFCTGQISVVESKAVPPTLAGGPLPSGLYALTGYVAYTFSDSGTTVPPGSYFKETMRLSTPVADADGGGGADGGDGGDGGTGDPDAGAGTALTWQNYVATNSSPMPATQTGTVIFTGTSLTINTTCPNAATNIFSAQYSNSGNTLQWLTQDPKGQSLLTYTKIGN